MEIITLKKRTRTSAEKINQEQAHNVRGNVFIKKAENLKKYPKLSEQKKENLAENA